MAWYTRVRDQLTIWYRSAAATLALLRPAPRPGITSGNVAALPSAELDLGALARSPTVFAGTTRLALGLATYPVRCYHGRGQGGRRKPLDPARVPWVAELEVLLQQPGIESAGELFPEPGEQLIAQIVADLRLTGNFFVAPVLTPDGRPVGLRRLHPRSVRLERRRGVEELVYTVNSQVTRYPRWQVAHGRLLSWEASGAGEMGTGAGEPLRDLVAAESAALQRTRYVVEQGGVDLVLTAKTPAGATYLSVEENRKKVVAQATEAIKASNGRRIYAIGGDIEVKDAGFKPADLQAPELMVSASKAELMALGMVPVAVGAEAGTYATAVQQYRVQAEQDEQIAMVVETCLLGPLARRFASLAGGRWAERASQVTAGIDLSQHPGYAYLRTDALTRCEAWVRLGWSAEQAAEYEGLDVAAPAGPPTGQKSPEKPGPALGDAQGPRRPVGDQADPDPEGPPPPKRGADFFAGWGRAGAGEA